MEEYYDFIRKYPANHNVEAAWQNIYTLVISTNKFTSFEEFKEKFPDYPYLEVVNRDLELAKRDLLPIRENERW